MLSLLLLAGSVQSCTAFKGKKTKSKAVEYSMTVAVIRPANKEEAFVTVGFLESARFYQLPKNANPVYLELLKESEKRHSAVLVKRADEKSDIIVSVRKKK